jgi:hypothetical protein
MIAFGLGVVVGVALSAVGVIVAMRWPALEREHAPIRYSAIGGGRHARLFSYR